MANCEQCGQPMVVGRCETCDGTGGWWCDSLHNFAWNVCPTCHGTCVEARCINHNCSSQPWYPASAREQGILRMARVNGGAK